ncbi:MAG: DUF4160 domain-containing protein [Bdellovibrionales bacterium]|nr:DUF4160 domain-containing protein [Bdellovibrionales bacterium]
MGRWKRNGVIIVMYTYDHDPRHVHIFEDGKRMSKFDVDHWRIMEGRLSSKAKKALDALKKEGIL